MVAGSALGVFMEQVALAAGASTIWGAPRGFPSALAVEASGTNLVVLEAALASEVELAVDLVLAVELVVVALGLVAQLALVVVATGALASLCAPLEAFKRSPSTRIS